MSTLQQEQEPAQDHCGRGPWCSGRTVTIENGQRIVLAAVTPRAYCDSCQDHIGVCLDGNPDDGCRNGMLALYHRLHRELGEARQAEIMVKVPFGPSLPLSEAIDAQMRAMTETLCSWEERLRDVARLSDLGAAGNRPQDSAADLDRSLRIISPRLNVLLSLTAQEMPRSLPALAVREEDEDCEIIASNGHTVTIAPRLGGEQAGQEILHLHYMARRLLLETSPPMPLLPDFRCRVCEKKLLRKAAPPWHEDGEWYWSRCDGCGDEMTAEDYKQNGLRWIAYERAHLATPVLGGLTPQRVPA